MRRRVYLPCRLPKVRALAGSLIVGPLRQLILLRGGSVGNSVVLVVDVDEILHTQSDTGAACIAGLDSPRQ